MADLQVDISERIVKWKELAPLPVCRTAHTAVLFGGNVYVGGGYEDSFKEISYRLDVYNLATNQWSPSPITTPYSFFALTVLDDKLVIAGGETKAYEAVKKVLVLNAGQWRDYSEMKTARTCATAVWYHPMLIVVGGESRVEGIRTRLSTTELLDTTNGCWYTCNNLPSPHMQLKAAIMNKHLYLLGGVDQDNKPSPQVFVASLDTLSAYQLNWQSAPNTLWCFSTPVVLYNKFLLTVGGRQSSDRSSQTCMVYTLDLSTNHWSYVASIPSERSFPAVVSMADKMIVIGGMTNKDRNYSNTVWIGVFE